MEKMEKTRKKVEKLIKKYDNIEFRRKLMNYVYGTEFAMLLSFKDVLEVIIEDDLLENYEKYEKEIDRCVDNCISILKILENEYSMYDNNIEDYVKTEHFQNTIFIIDNITKHIYNITHFCY